MSATNEITADELGEQITRHETELAEAERQIGVAVVDGKSPASATKRAREAREGIDRANAAREELERREAEAAEKARTGEASVARLAAYEWMANYLNLLEVYMVKRAELEAAEAAVKGLQTDPRFPRAKLGGRSHSVDESDLDTDLLHAIPDPNEFRLPREKGGFRIGLRNFGPERARELRGFAETRAEEERSGDGVDRSQPYGTWDRQMNEQRKAARREGST